MKNDDIKKFYFSKKIAKDVGVEEAMMFSNIFFWININKRRNDGYHFYEGKYWMYKTVRDFTEQYTFWTTAKVRRILNNLKKKGYVETGVFNKFGYDKTKWYTVAEKGHDMANSDKGFVETINSFEED
jgi:hypothetical protein